MSTDEARQHLGWCCERALEYIDAGEGTELALASLISDIHKYDGPFDEIRAYDMPAVVGSLASGSRPVVEAAMREIGLLE